MRVSIKRKLFLLALCLSFIPLIIFGFIVYNFSRDLLISQISSRIIKLSEEIETKINGNFSDLNEELERISSNGHFKLWCRYSGEKKEKADFLKEIFDINFKHFLKTRTMFQGLYYFSLNGGSNYFAGNPGNENILQIDTQALKIIDNYYYSSRGAGKSEDYIFFVKKITNENNTSGVFMAAYNYKSMNSLISNIKLGELKSLKIFIYNHSGTLQAGMPEKTTALKPEAFSSLNHGELSSITYENEECLGLLAPLKNIGAKCVILIQKSELMKPVEDLKESALILALIVSLLVIFLVKISSASFVKPILSLTNSAKIIAGGKLDEKLTVSGRDEIGELAVHFDIMRERIKDHIARLDQKVAERTKSIKDLLDNAGQGFLSFGGDYIVLNEFSRQCENIFGREIGGVSIFELLFEPDFKLYKTDKSRLHSNSPLLIMEQIIDSYFNNENIFNVMKKALPDEITTRDKILDLEFVFIYDEFGKAGKVMLIVTDITLQKELEIQTKTEQERNNLIVKIALDKHGFVDFFRDLHTTLNMLESLAVSENLNDEVISRIYRIVHTVKGIAPFYSFFKVMRAAHKVEDFLDELKSEKKLDYNSRREEILEKINKIIASVDDQLDMIQDYLTQDEILKGETHYEISEKQIADFAENIRESVKGDEKEQLLEALNQLKRYQIKYIIKRFAENTESLAKRLGKKINNIKIINEQILVDYKYLKPLIDVFVHILRNAVDHGIENPYERKKKGKSPEGNISITLNCEKIGRRDYFTVSFTDDGAGVDVESLKNVIVEKGFVTKEKIDKMQDNDVIQYIFCEGLSSKKNISHVSGRGIGMSAVKEKVDRFNGRININSIKDQGTTITISVPLRQSNK